MIFSLAVLDVNRRRDPVAKIPAAARLRKVLIGAGLDDVKTAISAAWGEVWNQVKRSDVFMQMDIIEGRKPAGFSAAVKAGALGSDVFLTPKVRTTK